MSCSAELSKKKNTLRSSVLKYYAPISQSSLHGSDLSVSADKGNDGDHIMSARSVACDGCLVYNDYVGR